MSKHFYGAGCKKSLRGGGFHLRVQKHTKRLILANYSKKYIFSQNLKGFWGYRLSKTIISLPLQISATKGKPKAECFKSKEYLQI